MDHVSVAGGDAAGDSSNTWLSRKHDDRCSAAPKPRTPPTSEGYDAVFKMLRDEFGIDFSHYKPSTVTRRIERRLSLNQSTDIDEYVDQLRDDPHELNVLYRDLLIGVTRFFRDGRRSSCSNATCCPSSSRRRTPEQDFRVWVAGCATGEEPYSLAILLHERLQAARSAAERQDLRHRRPPCLARVRQRGHLRRRGPGQRLPRAAERYFMRRGDRYQVSTELRQMVVFAPHNVIKDAPFTSSISSLPQPADLLPAAGAEEGAVAVPLRVEPRGVLFLGPSETLGELPTSSKRSTSTGRFIASAATSACRRTCAFPSRPYGDIPPGDDAVRRTPASTPR